MKLKSKPHEIEAFQFVGRETKTPDWFKEEYEKGRAFVTMGEFKGNVPSILVKSKRGTHTAYLEDWVCINAKGTLFVLSNEEIENGFEVAE